MSTQLKMTAQRPRSAGHLTEGLSRWQTIIVASGTMLALLLAALDQTIVGTAMPRIVADLNGLSYYAWVITAYLVASTVMVPVAGKLGDLFGRKPFLLSGMVGFVAVLIVAATLLFKRSKASVRDIDFPGAAALVAGLIPLMVALSITRDHAWTSPEVLGLLIGSAVMLGLFFVLEQRTDDPIVPFRLFKDATFSVSMLTSFLTGFAMFGAIIFVPLIYQGVLGVTATNSGQLLTPMMLGLVGASVLVGQVMVRIRLYRFLGTAGIALMLLGFWWLSQVTTRTSALEVVRDIVIVGAGLGATFPLYLQAVQNALPRQFLGVATSQIQFWRQIGGTIGTSVLGSVLASRLAAGIQSQAAGLALPPQAGRLVPSAGGNPQAVFDPSVIAARRTAATAAGGPQGGAIFDQVLHALRAGLAGTLHEVFLYSGAVLVVALVATLLLREGRLRGQARTHERTEEFSPAA